MSEEKTTMEEKEVTTAEETKEEVMATAETQPNPTATEQPSEPVNSPAEEPAPTEENNSAEVTVEETPAENAVEPAENAVETPAEEQTEEKAATPPAMYTYKTAIAVYTDAQALDLLRKKIYSFQEIDKEFLEKIAEDGAFKTEMKYVSVVRCNANAQYSWKTASKDGELHDHNETKAFSKDFCDDVTELNPFDFGEAKTINLDAPREDEKMLAKKSYSVAKAKKDFNTVIKQASPNKKAKFEKISENYETVYVPVLKTSCVFDGQTYLGYVNLLNGACVSEYKVSPLLQEAVISAMGRVKAVKGTLIQALVFLVLLCAMSLGKAFYHGIDALNVPVLWTGIIMGAAAIVPILCLGVMGKYKADKMKETAVQTGKMPVVKAAAWLVALSWLVCAAAVVVFFLKTVL